MRFCPRIVDTDRQAPIQCGSRFWGCWRLSVTFEDQTVSLIKIIVITIAVILSILFFGRFLF
jgi:hypothetical protein